MMSIELRNEPQMLQNQTYPSYDLQPLLLKRQRELEEARAFNAWLGERRLAQEGQRCEPADGGRAPSGSSKERQLILP